MIQWDAQWLGRVAYTAALEIQESLCVRQQPTVLGLEHEAIITLGKRGVVQEDVRASNDLPVVTAARGGQATLHAPGQLVIYPIMPVRQWNWGAREYVELLQLTTQITLKNLGIPTHRGLNEPGLYSENGKIAFFGVRISKGWSSHGIAINVGNDLGLFQTIRSCGRDEEHFARVQDFMAIDTRTLFERWIQELKQQITRRDG